MLHVSVEYNLHRKPSGSPSVIKLFIPQQSIYVWFRAGLFLAACVWKTVAWEGGPFPTPCHLLTAELILESTVKRLLHTVFPGTPWVWPSGIQSGLKGHHHNGALLRGHPAAWSAVVSVPVFVHYGLSHCYCVGIALNLLPQLLPAPMLLSHLQPTPPATSLASSC